MPPLVQSATDHGGDLWSLRQLRDKLFQCLDRRVALVADPVNRSVRELERDLTKRMIPKLYTDSEAKVAKSVAVEDLVSLATEPRALGPEEHTVGGRTYTLDNEPEVDGSVFSFRDFPEPQRSLSWAVDQALIEADLATQGQPSATMEVARTVVVARHV